jgi:hypothetical protein
MKTNEICHQKIYPKIMAKGTSLKRKDTVRRKYGITGRKKNQQRVKI